MPCEKHALTEEEFKKYECPKGYKKDYQKQILEDVNNYQVQINRLERWKQGQVHMLRLSLESEVEAEVVEAEVVK